MRITELLKPECVNLHGTVNSRDEAIRELVASVSYSGKIKDSQVFQEAVYAREAECSTGVGHGIAIPHGKTNAVEAPAISAMYIPGGVLWNEDDRKTTDLCFLIACPFTADNTYLDVISRLSELLMKDDLAEELRSAKSIYEFITLLEGAEERLIREEQEESLEPVSYDVLAVTACPTGIAHTYIAADRLIAAGKEMGVTIKVETTGSVGIKNLLTDEEIRKCKGIIVAADRSVYMNRFRGKRVLMTGVKTGIRRPGELIKKILDGNAPVFQGEEEAVLRDRPEDRPVDDSSSIRLLKGGTRIVKVLYKHLMTGISYMIPFIIAAGILTALSYILGNYSALSGYRTDMGGVLYTLGNQALRHIYPVMAAFIAMSIAGQPGFLVGFIGGVFVNYGYTLDNIRNYSSADSVPSGFIGAIIAGFIAGYLIYAMKRLFRKTPAYLESLQPVLIYPVAGTLLIGLAMLIINPITAALNEGLNDLLLSMSNSSMVLLGTILGGMMGVDMGGPVNKAAYVFATAQLTDAVVYAEQYKMVAAVMAGGMVPPLAIALCTTFFKNRFTERGRKEGVLNYIMGLTFISEGAIPFVAKDPLGVLPPCIVGAAVAGGLSALFGCQSSVPHGGIFVVTLMKNSRLFLLAVLIGSVVGALLMAAIKKPIEED